MNDEYYSAKEGECYRSIGNGFVLKVVKKNNKYINECIVAGRCMSIGATLLMSEEDALKFHKANFERYYCFNDYLKQIDNEER